MKDFGPRVFGRCAPVTRNGIAAIAIRLPGVIIAACLIVGCAERDSSDYCDNHYLFHESHADKIGKLDIAYSEDGLVIAMLSLPHSIFVREGESSGTTIDEIAGMLNDYENVFAVQADATCTETDVSVRTDAGLLSARYELDCGAGTKVGQLDILLFESVAALDEVEAFVKTPAASKQFAISRQCESAISRLHGKSSDRSEE